MNDDVQGSEEDDFWDDPRFEELVDRLWAAAVTASGQHWNEHDYRHLVPPPEKALADVLTNNNNGFNLEMQKRALEWAAGVGEEMIRRHELELAEMRRALGALRQPRSDLLRSRIAAIKPVTPDE